MQIHNHREQHYRRFIIQIGHQVIMLPIYLKALNGSTWYTTSILEVIFPAMLFRKTPQLQYTFNNQKCYLTTLYLMLLLCVECNKLHSVLKCVCVYKPHTNQFVYDSHLQNITSFFSSHSIHLAFSHPSSFPILLPCATRKIPNWDFIWLQQYDANAAKHSSQFNSLMDTAPLLSERNTR